MTVVGQVHHIPIKQTRNPCELEGEEMTNEKEEQYRPPDVTSCCRPVDTLPRCERCLKRKKPIGRSVADCGYCDDECIGYRSFPWPVCYWPRLEISPWLEKELAKKDEMLKVAEEALIKISTSPGPHFNGDMVWTVSDSSAVKKWADGALNEIADMREGK